MASRLRPNVALALTALRALVRNHDLAWLEVSWTASVAAAWIFQIVALVLSYRVAGAAGVAAVGLARMLPAAVSAPLVVLLERRLPGPRLAIGIHATRMLAVLAAAAGLVTGASPAVLLALVAVEAAAGVLMRPIMFGLVPALASSPEEVVAANVGASTGEGAGTLVGPILGGLIVAAAGPIAGCIAAAFVLAAALVAAAFVRVSPDAVVRPVARSPRHALRTGVVALRRSSASRLVFACFFAQVVVRGLLSVLIVVAAFNVLGLGDSGVGVLNAAMGLGGFVGAAIALGIAGSSRTSVPFALGLVGWGAPIAVIGIVPAGGVAVAMLAFVGGSNAVLDVAGFTLLQRLVPNAERTAVFGLFEVVAAAGVALGSVAAPVLLGVAAPQAALVVTGLILPATALVAWPRLARIDDDAVVPHAELNLLRSIPMFAPLPMTVIERLAGDLVRVEFAPGELLIRQGDLADRFYAIERGEVEVIQDSHRLRTYGPGGAVGEIGLLRRVPRTATVRATSHVLAYALSGDAFVGAVMGNRASTSAADGVISARLDFSRASAAVDPGLVDASATDAADATADA